MAKVSGTVVGFAQLVKYADIKMGADGKEYASLWGGGIWWLFNLAVSKRYGGRGIGNGLMTEVEK